MALLPASGFTAPDTAYTTIGGIDFTLSCTTSGGTADITYTLGSQLDLTKTKVYKYNSTTHEVTEITSQVSLSNVAGKTVIAYSATDGAANDEDAVQNSAIVDPVYIATETPVVTEPIISDGTTPLASTGDNILVIILGVVVAMGVGLVVLRRL